MDLSGDLRSISRSKSISKTRAGDSNHPRRKMGTKWVQFAPISMIVGQDCVVFYEESESGLQMAPNS